ncbi:zinc-dependent metalloprotease, partial [Actinomyces naeslundii]
ALGAPAAGGALAQPRGRRRYGPGPGLGSLLLHRLMGLEAKEAQYADGTAFVRSVVARIGHEGLNVVWTDPALLPTPAEIARPDVWVRRVG